LKICVLVKAVPDAATPKRIDPATGRLDRGGETNLNSYDANALEVALQLREGGALAAPEVVAVTMGPAAASKALQKAAALGADRSLHLIDDALAGSDLIATAYALSLVLEREMPDLVLLGQQSEDGAGFALGAAIAEYLQMPSLTQVVSLTVDGGELVLERQTGYGYDTIRVAPPAVISVSDAINVPRYPSLKAIMGAKRKPVQDLSLADVGIDPARVGADGSRVACGEFQVPAAKAAGQIIEDEDTDATVTRVVAYLQERKLI
jgi:electron transfer flavoprotein beta subunit